MHLQGLWTDGQTDGDEQGDSYLPQNCVCGEIVNNGQQNYFKTRTR